jgi:hypothetical protein
MRLGGFAGGCVKVRLALDSTARGSIRSAASRCVRYKALEHIVHVAALCAGCRLVPLAIVALLSLAPAVTLERVLNRLLEVTSALQVHLVFAAHLDAVGLPFEVELFGRNGVQAQHRLQLGEHVGGKCGIFGVAVALEALGELVGTVVHGGVAGNAVYA